MRYLAAILIFAMPSVALPFFLDTMKGSWRGNATAAYYEAKNKIPTIYSVNVISVSVMENGMIRGSLGNGCEAKGMIMRSSSRQYPIKGYIDSCNEKKLNGAFEGMFNSGGEIRIIVKDKKLGRGDFYGVLKRSVIHD